MKKIILGSVSAAALLFAGAAYAAGNSSTIDQDRLFAKRQRGSDEFHRRPVAWLRRSDATQASDEYNAASVVQGGSGNHATVTQSQGAFGADRIPSNISNSDQEGVNNTLVVVQVGNNTSSVLQTNSANGEYALVGQNNNANSAAIVQSGTNEMGLINQDDGSSNVAGITQSGIGDGNHTPVAYGTPVSGPGNLVWHENVPNDSSLPNVPALTTYGPAGAYIDQVGSNHTGSINQSGYWNFADVAQGDGGNGASNGSVGDIGAITQGAGQYYSDAVMFQDGSYNIASISQTGSGSSYSTVWQLGNSNVAYSTQVGSEHSAINQGFDGDGFGGSAVSNNYANVYQQGGGDTSTVTQTGNSDQAWVSQYGAGATSTVNQGGSFNLAVVHQ